MKLRFGILGTAGIARKNWRAIHDSGNATVVAVGSRDEKRSRAFIDECQAQVPMESAPRAFGSYADLLASSDVDAVYVPLPTGVRKEWLIRAAETGKHIVCEKPCATSAADLREILDACSSHRVQFMDGVMFVHTQRTQRLLEVLGSGQAVGQIRRIASAFSFYAGPEFFGANIRTLAALEPAGCLGDLGWYCFRFILMALNWQMPRHVTGRVLTSHPAGNGPGSVPVEFSGELLFDAGVSASFYCAFTATHQQWAHLSGTRGYLTVDDFVHPFRTEEPAFATHQVLSRKVVLGSVPDHQTQTLTVSELRDGKLMTQEANLFHNFSAQVQSGKLNADWPAAALKTQILTSACLDSARQDGRPVRIE